MKYIYALIDPRDRQIRYIGQTDNVHTRYGQHMNDTAQTKKVAWLTELKSLGIKPDFIVLQDCENDEVHHIENWWIAVSRRQGMNLVNSTMPGEWRFKDDFTNLYSDSLKSMNTDTIQLARQEERLIWLRRIRLVASGVIWIGCFFAAYYIATGVSVKPGVDLPTRLLVAAVYLFPVAYTICCHHFTSIDDKDYRSLDLVLAIQLICSIGFLLTTIHILGQAGL